MTKRGDERRVVLNSPKLQHSAGILPGPGYVQALNVDVISSSSITVTTPFKSAVIILLSTDARTSVKALSDTSIFERIFKERDRKIRLPEEL